MKIKRNPENPTPVMFPFLRGVYLGATLDSDETKKEGAPRFKFSDDEHDLGKDAFKRDPKAFAYWTRKVKEGEVLAVDDEMAKACGVKLAPAEPPAPAPVSAKPTTK